MRRAVWILLGLLCLSGSAPAPPPPASPAAPPAPAAPTAPAAPPAPPESAGPPRPIGCEPAGPLDLRARLLSLQDTGREVRATVEVTLRSGAGAPEAWITASRLLDGRSRPLEVADPALGALAPGAMHRRSYALDLERGREHHLFFHVRTDAVEGEPAASVYLRVNLDPAREPEDFGSLLQFRALPGDE